MNLKSENLLLRGTAMTLEEMAKRLEAMEKRLKVAEDIEAIKQLHTNYINNIAFLQWDKILDCFAENASAHIASGTYTGKVEIKRFFDSIHEGHSGKEGFILTHPLISVNGDTAKGSWILYTMYSYQVTGQALFWVQGLYDCEYIRENGQWKIWNVKFEGRLHLPGVDHPPYPGV
jgi:ketosteroid isomerase-like protein